MADGQELCVKWCSRQDLPDPASPMRQVSISDDYMLSWDSVPIMMYFMRKSSRRMSACQILYIEMAHHKFQAIPCRLHRSR